MSEIILTPEEENLILKRRAREEKKKLSNIKLKDVLKNYPKLERILKFLQLPALESAHVTMRNGCLKPVKVGDKLLLQEDDRECVYNVCCTIYKFDNLTTFMGKNASFVNPSDSPYTSYNNNYYRSYTLSLTVLDGRVLYVSCYLFGFSINGYFNEHNPELFKFNHLAYVPSNISIYREFYYDAVKDFVMNTCHDFERRIKYLSDDFNCFLNRRACFSSDKKVLELTSLPNEQEELIAFLCNKKKGGK